MPSLLTSGKTAALMGAMRGWNFMNSGLGRDSSFVYASQRSASTPRSRPGGGLDAVREVPLAAPGAVGQEFAPLGVVVLELGAAVLLVLREVVVAAVGDALELAEAGGGEGEAVLDVAGALRVVGELVLVVLAEDEVLAPRPMDFHHSMRKSRQNLYQATRLVGVAEELELHLLELARAEGEVAGRDLVAEARAVLPMPKGTFTRVVSTTFLNWTKMPCAVSGRR
jgi:hypothetical protein